MAAGAAGWENINRGELEKLVDREGLTVMAFIRLLMFALFVFLVVTVAAFVYLEWWQAILVSFATFVLLTYVGKLMIRSAIAGLGNFASELFRVKSRVLRGATVDVHSVHRLPVPKALAILKDGGSYEDSAESADRAWYQIEVTLFPAAVSPGPVGLWDLDDLQLVPFDTPDRKGLTEADELEKVRFDRVWIIEKSKAIEQESSRFQGPQRLRIAAAFPKGIPVWKFRYLFEQFGRIELSTRKSLS